MIPASNVLQRAKDVLNDAGSVRWTEAELMRWASDGQRDIVIFKPSATATHAAVLLVAGKTLQALPEDGALLLDIVRNLGVDGETPGRAVRPIERSLMDAQSPNWHAEAPAAAVEHFMYDPRTPRRFYIYPALSADAYVEMSYARMPAEIEDEDDLLAVDDLYGNALLDYILHRAFAKDADSAGNLNRATLHYNAFAQAVGIRGQSEVVNSPAAKMAAEGAK